MDQDLTSEIISKNIRYHSSYESRRLPKNVREDKQWSLCKPIRWRKRYLRGTKKDLVVSIKDIDAVNAAAFSNKLHQITNGSWGLLMSDKKNRWCL